MFVQRTAVSKLEYALSLAFFGIAGEIARIGLITLTEFEYGLVLWANVAGCVVMGAHASLVPKKLARRISVGFCGALTSFSGLIITLYEYSRTPEQTWANKGYSVMAFLAYIIIQMSASIGSYQLGTHLGLFIQRYKLRVSDRFDMPFCYMTAVAGLLAWIAMLVLTITVPRGRYWTFSGLFSPLGVYVRHWLTKMYNKGDKRYGTLACNLVGTLLACVFTLLVAHPIASTQLQQSVLYALINGLCGSITTVSTFVVELCTLPLACSYAYAFVSLGVAFCLTVIINGSYDWTR